MTDDRLREEGWGAKYRLTHCGKGRYGSKQVIVYEPLI